MVVADTDVTRIIFTTLCRDEDSSVGTLVAIKSNSGSILQDGYVVYLVSADNADVTLYTIDQY